MAIDVLFTGLMLICLDGHADTCPVRPYEKNTTWVVKADGASEVCGRHSKEETNLELQLDKGNFKVEEDPSRYCDGTDPIKCKLPAGEICVTLYDARGSILEPAARPYGNFSSLLRMGAVDRRLESLNQASLYNADYVPTRISFPNGDMIDSGTTWKPDESVQWHRTDESGGGSLPHDLADRLKVGYKSATWMKITDCAGHLLVRLTALKPQATATFRNSTVQDPTPDYAKSNTFEDLAYLLWYYRLGTWSTASGRCPDYNETKKNPVQLRCEKPACSYYPPGQSDHRFWPVMLGF